MSTETLWIVVAVVVAVLLIAVVVGLVVARNRRISLRDDEELETGEKEPPKGGTYQAGGGFAFSAGTATAPERPDTRGDRPGRHAAGDDTAGPSGTATPVADGPTTGAPAGPDTAAPTTDVTAPPSGTADAAAAGTAPAGVAGTVGTAPADTIGTAPADTAGTAPTGTTGTAPADTTGSAPPDTTGSAPTSTAPTSTAPTSTAPAGTTSAGTTSAGATETAGTATADGSETAYDVRTPPKGTPIVGGADDARTPPGGVHVIDSPTPPRGTPVAPPGQSRVIDTAEASKDPGTARIDTRTAGTAGPGVAGTTTADTTDTAPTVPGGTAVPDSASGTGTATPGTGTASPSTGTAPPSTGTARPGTGTAPPGTGTASPSTGTASPDTGTAPAGTGTAATAGTAAPSTDTAPSGTDTTTPASTGTAPGVGTAAPGTGTAGPGTGTAPPGTGTAAATGTAAPATGTAATGSAAAASASAAATDTTAPVAPGAPADDIDPADGRLGRLRGRLSRSRSGLGQSLLGLLGAGQMDEESWEDVEATLLQADLGPEMTEEITTRLREQLASRGVRTAEQARAALHDVLTEALDTRQDRSVRALPHDGRPAVLLVVGVNGTGKTTTTGKLARVLVAGGHRVTLGAADTFRAAAAEQLVTWGERSGAGVVRGPEGSDPAAVAFDAVKRGTDDHVDAVLLDTAGRLHTKTGLMDELGKVKRVVEKQARVDEVLLVLDATTGQNGLTQARVFGEVVDVTGIALTKLDGTAKGGIVFRVQRELGVPVKLVGLGEGPDDLAPFEPSAFVDALLN